MFADDWADLVEDVRTPDRAVWFASSFSRASLNASPTSRATSFKPSVFRPRSSAAAARRCPAFEVASFNCSPALPAASRNCSPVVPRVRFSISLTGNAAATTAPAAMPARATAKGCQRHRRFGGNPKATKIRTDRRRRPEPQAACDATHQMPELAWRRSSSNAAPTMGGAQFRIRSRVKQKIAVLID